MNLQNLPYTHNIRSIFRAPEGWSIGEADFSQLELRIAGEYSQDALLVSTYQNNRDLHAIRTMRTTGYTEEEWNALDPKLQKELRKKAKPVNFGYLYGMDWKKFQHYALVKYDVVFSAEESQKVREQFFEDHYGLPAWYKKVEQEALKYGYVETLTGRRRNLPNIKLNPDSSNEARRKYQNAVRQAINAKVQGFGGECKYMALIEARQTISYELFKPFGEVHDSIVGLIRNGYEEEVLTGLVHIMRKPKLLAKLGVELSVPIDAEASYGPSLGEMKELKVA